VKSYWRRFRPGLAQEDVAGVPESGGRHQPLIKRPPLAEEADPGRVIAGGPSEQVGQASDANGE
jgi:hypothetical protein